MNHNPFFPAYGKTVSVATSAGVGNVTVPADARQLLLQNVGTVTAWVRVKPAGVSTDASASDLPLPAGASMVISKDGGNPGTGDGQTTVSVYSTGAGSTVYITPGDGWGT